MRREDLEPAETYGGEGMHDIGQAQDSELKYWQDRKETEGQVDNPAQASLDVNAVSANFAQSQATPARPQRPVLKSAPPRVPPRPRPAPIQLAQAPTPPKKAKDAKEARPALPPRRPALRTYAMPMDEYGMPDTGDPLLLSDFEGRAPEAVQFLRGITSQRVVRLNAKERCVFMESPSGDRLVDDLLQAARNEISVRDSQPSITVEAKTLWSQPLIQQLLDGAAKAAHGYDFSFVCIHQIDKLYQDETLRAAFETEVRKYVLNERTHVVLFVTSTGVTKMPAPFSTVFGRYVFCGIHRKPRKEPPDTSGTLGCCGM
jgi:hypothetical protein